MAHVGGGGGKAGALENEEKYGGARHIAMDVCVRLLPRWAIPL